MSNKKKLKLNLGCGGRLLEDYVNIDSVGFGDKDSGRFTTQMDVRSLEYSDDTVDEILAEFVLEHIPYFEVAETIWEWWRVLKPGGTLKIMVPDFDIICREWLDGNLSYHMLHCQLFNSPIINPKKITPHYNAFNKTFLRELLEQEGFEIESMENTGTDVTVTAIKKSEKEGVCR